MNHLQEYSFQSLLNQQSQKLGPHYGVIHVTPQEDCPSTYIRLLPSWTGPQHVLTGIDTFSEYGFIFYACSTWPMAYRLPNYQPEILYREASAKGSIYGKGCVTMVL